jgi:acyl dehydratase
MFITQESLINYSGGDRSDPKFPKKTIHTDLELARKCGLPERIASGAMFEGLIAELMLDIVGSRWYKVGKMRLKFVHRVNIGDTIVANVKVDNYENDASCFEVWCENQYKVRVVVGQAIIKEGKC